MITELIAVNDRLVCAIKYTVQLRENERETMALIDLLKLDFCE